MKRTLELTFDLNRDDFTLDIREPESSIRADFSFPYSFFDLTDFNQVVGEELYSWISLWKDEQDDMED